MNFGLFGMLDRFKDLKHQWEKDYLGNKDIIFRNTFGQIEHILTTCGPNGTRFEFECYDTAHLYNLKYFFDRGLVQAPLFIQTVFGLQGGIGAHPDDVMHMKRTADRLFGDNYRWSVLGAGRNQMNIAAMAAAMGGNVRVGLEDSLWDGPGKLAETNAAQVRRVRSIIEGWASPSPRPTRRGRSSRSRAGTRWASDPCCGALRQPGAPNTRARSASSAPAISNRFTRA